MSSSFIGQPNEKGGAYALFFMFDSADAVPALAAG